MHKYLDIRCEYFKTEGLCTGACLVLVTGLGSAQQAAGRRLRLLLTAAAPLPSLRRAAPGRTRRRETQILHVMQLYA
jgi:hypothetical protein